MVWWGLDPAKNLAKTPAQSFWGAGEEQPRILSRLELLGFKIQVSLTSLAELGWHQSFHGLPVLGHLPGHCSSSLLEFQVFKCSTAAVKVFLVGYPSPLGKNCNSHGIQEWFELEGT